MMKIMKMRKKKKSLKEKENRFGVVVAETEVGAHVAGGDALVGLGDDVVDGGEIALVRAPDVGVELEGVDLPELHFLLFREQVPEVEIRV